jgi:rhodanese-related sulfurtransferase
MLRLLIGSPGVCILDVNGLETYNRYHLPGAKLTDRLFDRASLPEPVDSVLVFYSKNPQCTRALDAGKLALKIGFTKVFWMKAGIEGWLSTNRSATASPRRQGSRKHPKI